MENRSTLEDTSERTQNIAALESPKIHINKAAGSGLTLVIPSLKSLKAQKSSKDLKPRSEEDTTTHQAKPLKEVLSKLIVQIKKKDDYAFFLHPVDVANVPGYSDVVARGKYRSLEDFTSDLKLQSLRTVIQYETDWNIEIEKMTRVHPLRNGDADGGRRYESARAFGIDFVPTPTRPEQTGPARTLQEAGASTALSETLEPDGGLPGSKDGLGSFPPGSDWAKTMVALKLKGKRYKTKKERLRIEREGPPLLPDGSLDYTEMEDPFSVLSVFVPDPPSRPHLVPLYPPLAGKQPRRRHWTIVRNATWRQKGKEREDEAEGTKVAELPRGGCHLAEEMRRRGMTPPDTEKETVDHEVNMQLIRERLNCDNAAKKLLPVENLDNCRPGACEWRGFDREELLVNQRAAEAEEYIRDLVYGGVEGLAYVRSLAEFVDGDCYIKKMSLGMPLAKWVETNIVDPLTDGRHSLLQETALALARQATSHRKTSPQIQARNVPDELFLSEEEWIGKSLKEKRRKEAMSKLEAVAAAAHPSAGDTTQANEPNQQTPKFTGLDPTALKERLSGRLSTYEQEGPAELHEVLEYVANVIIELDRRIREKKSKGESTLLSTQHPEAAPNGTSAAEPADASGDVVMKVEDSATSPSTSEQERPSAPTTTEDPAVRNLRLNLLALAKRAPLDIIARLPKDLVPEHIRHFVPTLGSTG
ncbi:hypothetical protein BJ912DRAFT_1030533 [Pholiota molesta]|nr:hypothetical protein BJ912DRAFT_1030533 [Pholiota molesta]